MRVPERVRRVLKTVDAVERCISMNYQTILIVDDEQRFVLTTTKIFERLGYAVMTATRGEEALDLLEGRDVGVVLMDVSMPGMSGIETLAEIKKRNPLVEVIMITGALSRDLAAEGFRLGAYDFLLKPVSISDIVKKVEGAFDKRRGIEKQFRATQDQ
jgi:DNA-binding NtrC family response regulator